jgi:primosomal protein N' (replication factor Y)
MTILRVALDVPLAQLFDYSWTGAAPAAVGKRVVVPLGKRTAMGVVVEVAERSALPESSLRAARDLLQDAPGLNEEILGLLRFAADYYHYPLGQAVAAALPLRLRRIGLTERPSWVYALTESGRAVADDA